MERHTLEEAVQVLAQQVLDKLEAAIQTAVELAALVQLTQALAVVAADKQPVAQVVQV
jgi:FtsZ-binding cell division protein ZapB